MQQSPQLVLFKLKYNDMKTALKNHLDLKLSLTSFVLIFFVLAAFSQEKKVIKRDIIIKNGDTLINGKKLSEVDRLEQVKLRKELHSLERSRVGGQDDLVIKKKARKAKAPIKKM